MRFARERRGSDQPHRMSTCPPADVLLEGLTPLGFRVRVTRERWEMIATVKHLVMTGREDTVKLADWKAQQNASEPIGPRSATLLQG
jgi:hypothetical protein